MNDFTNRAKRLWNGPLKYHHGKIIGALVGLLIGLRLFGLLFGLLAGYLVDSILHTSRLQGRDQGGGSSGSRATPDLENYRILGVDPDASTDEIKRVYRALAVQFHPDSLHHLDEKQRKTAEEAFIKIREAYESIMKEHLNG